MMVKIGVMVIDDDAIARRTLARLISQHDSLALLGEAECADSALPLIEQRCPEVLFLDVQMPRSSGFDLLRRLPQAPKVVFVSCSPSHTLQAFDVDAVDYLLKPVIPERFAATVGRLERLLFSSPQPPEKHHKTDRICLRADGNVHILPLPRLIVLEAEGNFTRVHSVDTTPLLISRSIGDFEERLPAPPFVRLDRSYLVNLDRLNHLERVSRDLSHLWLHGLSAPVPLGRTATERLRKLLESPLREIPPLEPEGLGREAAL